jgi:hypothetical protein
MINKSSFLVSQVQAVTDFAVSHHGEEDLLNLLKTLQAGCARIEEAIAWKKIHHGGDAA